jgi:hypothetical protein
MMRHLADPVTAYSDSPFILVRRGEDRRYAQVSELQEVRTSVVAGLEPRIPALAGIASGPCNRVDSGSQSGHDVVGLARERGEAG